MSGEPVYLSPAGLQKLKDELVYLKTDKRREVMERIGRAKELGDLRENAEYHDAKDEAAFVDGRIQELEDLIPRAVIIEGGAKDSVSIGSVVHVSYDGKERTFSIVGAQEADPLSGRISNESPTGLALLGKKVGETAEVSVPAGVITYTITAIK